MNPTVLLKALGTGSYRLTFRAVRALLSLKRSKAWARNSLHFGDVIPLLSDIDVSFYITNDGTDDAPGEILRLKRRLKMIKKLIPVMGEANFYTPDLARFVLRNGNRHELDRDPLLRTVAGLPQQEAPARDGDGDSESDKLVFLLRMLESDFKNLTTRSTLREQKWHRHLKATDSGTLPEPFSFESLVDALDERHFRQLGSLPLKETLLQLGQEGLLSGVERIYRQGSTQERLSLFLLFPVQWLESALASTDTVRAWQETVLLNESERKLATAQLRWELAFLSTQFEWLTDRQASDAHFKRIFSLMRFISADESTRLREEIRPLGIFDVDLVDRDLHPGEISPSFCVSPWTSFEIEPGGRIAVCAVDPIDRAAPGVGSIALSEALNSDRNRNLRTTMLRGEWAEMCRECKSAETRTGLSERTRINDRFVRTYGTLSVRSVNPLEMAVRAGNDCALECLNCTAERSSSIHQRVHGVPMSLDADFRWHKRPGFWDEFVRSNLQLRELTFAGGDGFSFPEHREILQQLASAPFASRLTISYKTNGLVDITRFLELWKSFERVKVLVCINDIGERDSYLRHPCSWATVQANLKHLDETPGYVFPGILFFVTALNAHRLPEIYDWFRSQNFRKMNTLAEHPVPEIDLRSGQAHMSIQACPPALKTKVRIALQEALAKDRLPEAVVAEILDHMAAADTYDFRTLKRLRALDQVRGTDFESTFPELVPFFGSEQT
jgi:hypothetical protein